jgi:GH24 family phage-related lysozyme (muramidase)
MPAPLRDVPQAAVDLIKSFEGVPDGDPSTVNIDAYLCPAGVWTIGWGHALMDAGAQLKGAQNKARARQLYPGGITREQAEALLRADLIPRAASVSSLLKVAVDDHQFGALIALVFNIGAANLAASTLLRKLNAGDATGAAEQFLAWDKARVDGVLQPLAGLTRRRKAERAMFLGQDWRTVAATRGRQSLAVLPVPDMPAEDRLAAKKAASKKAPVKKAQVPAAVKPRARTTTPKAPPPARSAARKAPRTAR